MSSAVHRPICRSVHTGFFQSKEYRSLPSDGHARLLLLCLLIHPHGGTFHLPGLYHVGPETLREAASMPRRNFTKGLGDLVQGGLLNLDEDSRLIWIPVALKLVGPPGNPNVAKGYARSLGQLPASPLVAEAVEAYREHLQAFGEAFLEPFAKAFETVSKGSQKTSEKDTGGFANASDNSNKDTDNHFYLNHNQEIAVDRSRFLAFAAQAGWVGVSEAKVSRLLDQVPSLTMQELEEFGRSVARRGDVRDPIRYLGAMLAGRDGGKGRPSRDPAALDARLLVPEDGSDMTFDD